VLKETQGFKVLKVIQAGLKVLKEMLEQQVLKVQQVPKEILA
jgi:hypothetical protein